MADNDNDNDPRTHIDPSLRLAEVATWQITRVMVDRETGAEALVVLPYKWPADVTQEEVGAAVGGGEFRAQARSPRGTFVKGAKPVTLLFDGEARAFVPPNAPAVVAEAPRAPEVPGVPNEAAHVAGGAAPLLGAISVPVPVPLAGQPGALLDLHGLHPEARAVSQTLAGLTSHVWAMLQSVAASEGAARATVSNLAVKSMEETARGINAASGTAIKVLTEQLESQGNRVRDLTAENDALKVERGEHLRELGELRLRVGLNLPPGASKPRGLLDVLEAVAVEVVRKLGVPVAAQALGVPVESLGALEAKARDPSP